MQEYYPVFRMSYQPPHVSILAAAMETGFPGAVFYVAAMLLPFYCVFRNRRYLQDDGIVMALVLILAVMVIDLDGFKAINDDFGHAIGDSVIKQVAGALLRTVRSSDMVARFGGDEFALIVPEADRNAAIHLAEKIKMVLSSTRLHLPNDSQEAQALFNLADQRMYRAKRSKQGSIIYTETDML